jgi:hypothetical protein
MTQATDLDFEIISENWTKYRLLPDNTILRVRIAVAKVWQKVSDTGDLGFAVGGPNIVSVVVPESLLKKKGSVPIQDGQVTPTQINDGENMEIKPLKAEEYWQEYRTKNGWVIMVKPEVRRAVRIRAYLEIGNTGRMEPFYFVETAMSVRYQVATGIKGIDSSFTIKEGKERLETENFWAEFRVKTDDRIGDRYVDVLIGNKGESEAHSHLGLNLDQSTRFVEPRGLLNTMRREVDSKQEGRLADETIVYSEPKVGRPKGKCVLKMIIDGPTRTITPKFEEALMEETP